jgi:hypothetical protein
MIGENSEVSKIFLRSYIQMAGYFKVECESVSSCECKFLEVIVKKRTREFLTIPSYKSTNINKPLEASSAHPPYVHNSWPRALVRRTKGLASNKAGEIEAMNMLRRRFVSNFAPDEQLMMIDDDGDKQKIITKPINKCTNKENKVWACFAYHPVIHGAVKRAMDKIRRCPYSNSLLKDSFGKSLEIGVSWYNVLPKLESIITKDERPR